MEDQTMLRLLTAVAKDMLSIKNELQTMHVDMGTFHDLMQDQNAVLKKVQDDMNGYHGELQALA